jgi:PTH1 family peptidyl-tRNA hydrolase
MLLIVGLGNPGPAYIRNKHNVGFMAIDQVADSNNFSPFSSAKIAQSHATLGEISAQKVLLLKPMTFMNNSGESVRSALDFFKLTVDQVFVIHDDLELAPAEVRLKKGGGHGGHNGLRSISTHIGQGYRRLRIGIGHPGIKALVSPHVLSNFSPKDTWVEPLVQGIGVLFPHLIWDKGFKDGSTFMEEMKVRMS